MKKRYFLGLLVLLTIATLLLPGFLSANPDLPKVQKNLIVKPPPNLTPVLKATIRTTAGSGCCWQPSDNNPLDAILVAFFDMDIIELKNFGLVSANQGTMTVEWYDLYQKKTMKNVYDFQEVKPDESKYLSFNPMYIIVKKSEGISIRIDYTDAANKNYHYQRTVKSCPDSF
jgi:hypothetical protein